MKPRFVILIPLLGLGGCAAGSYCEGQQDYQRARSVPVLQPAEGLRVPSSGNALRIPPAPENSVPYGEVGKDEDGDEFVSCLDKPPELPPQPERVEPAAPEAPAPATAPENKPS
jgi:hypothetical protein